MNKEGGRGFSSGMGIAAAAAAARAASSASRFAAVRPARATRALKSLLLFWQSADSASLFTGSTFFGSNALNEWTAFVARNVVTRNGAAETLVVGRFRRPPRAELLPPAMLLPPAILLLLSSAVEGRGNP